MSENERPVGLETSLWDKIPKPLKVVLVVGLAIYFGGAFLAPFFWKLNG